MKNIFSKLFFRRKPQVTELPHYQWIVHHCRSTDRVFFGPFKSFNELDDFFKDPKNQGIQIGIELLISPTCPKDQYWYNPDEFLREKYPELYFREEENA